MTKESAKEMEQLYTDILQIYRSLEALQRPVSSWDDVLVYIVTQQLDSESIRAWEHHLGDSTDPPTWTRFIKFLITRLRSLQAIEKSRSEKPKVASHSNALKTHYQGKSKETNHDNTLNCAICSGNHHTAICTQYFTKSRTQRLSLIAKHRLCYNCLGPHRVSNCNTTRRCKKCGKKHHTSIHSDSSFQTTTLKVDSERSTKPSKSTTAKQPEVRVLLSNINQRLVRSQTLLATAQVQVISLNGNITKARLLLDQGSEISLIKEKPVQRLQLPRRRSSTSLIGIGKQLSNKTRGLVYFKIKPHFCSTFEIFISAHVLSTLTTSILAMEISRHSWDHLEDLQLADPQFSSPGAIDILLGADVYGQIITEGVIKGQVGTPIAQSTNLGWIISGPTGNKVSQQPFQSYYVSDNTELCNLMQRFWEMESIPVKHISSLTVEEQDCENHFKATHSRDIHGRYIVKLPFKNSIEKLGNSKQKAIHLSNKLIRRCSNDDKYAQLYSEFMNKYQRLQHMTQVPDSLPEPSHAFYLPHHGVWKENSLTTKLRVVFNGSSPTTTGYSLNDLLHSGSKLQTDIFDVLLWFRQFQFVFSTDIEKMFRQIKVHPDDWKYQRIIWNDQNGHLTFCELTTVTYGLVCAPFLALRVIQQLTQDKGDRFPKAVSTMIKGRYVDDLFEGADTISEAQVLVNQVNQLCMASGFPLQKWISNELTILNSISLENCLNSSSVRIDDNLVVHFLGLLWHPATDSFGFLLGSFSTEIVTKRTMLSSIAKIFDLLGFLLPVIITAKIMIQRL